MVLGPILKDWIKRYLIEVWHRLFQEYFKSYRIAFMVALWLHFEQLSSYLFVNRRLVGVAVWKYYMDLNTKLKNWIKTYLIISRSFQVIQNSFQGGLMACFLIVIQLFIRPYVFWFKRRWNFRWFPALCDVLTYKWFVFKLIVIYPRISFKAIHYVMNICLSFI